MKFQDHYKNEMNSTSPTEEQCRKIYSGVYEKIHSSETSVDLEKHDKFSSTNYARPIISVPKKALKLKGIAVSCASAACVAVVAGIILFARLSIKDEIYANNTKDHLPGNGTPGYSESNIYFSDPKNDKLYDFSYSDQMNQTADGITDESNNDSADALEGTNGSPLFSDNVYMKLVFYSNCNECILYKSSGSQRFIGTNPPTGGSENDADTPQISQHYELVEIQNNLQKKLSVTVKEDIISISDENGELIGFYIAE